MGSAIQVIDIYVSRKRDIAAACRFFTDALTAHRVECDHGRLKARLRPMRGLKRDRTASVVIRGHALIQNIRRDHYEVGTDTTPHLRLVKAFKELAEVI